MAARSESRHLENVCRLCLTDASEAGDMLPIFPVRGGNPNNPTSVVNRIFQCTSLKLEQKDGIPSTICELCSVRLEDWFAFREQCLGSDEYLRVAVPDAFYTLIEGSAKQQQHLLPLPLPQPPADGGAVRASSMAKRRKSTFEWTLGDGKGNTTGQKVIVEVLGERDTSEHEQTGAPPMEQRGGGGSPTYESIPLPEHGVPGTTDGVTDRVLQSHGIIGGAPREEESWSKEYCARVNSLMQLVNGTRPYKCKICSKLFKCRSNLRRHIKVGHSDEIVEGESPPPECYDYGHIHRPGGAWKPGAAGEELLPPQPPPSVQLPPGPPSHHPYPPPPAATTVVAVKRKRRSTDPPIVGPHRCHLCPRSFKMPAHLAVHMKTHQRVEEVPATGLELKLRQQLQQQQQQRQREAELQKRRMSVFSERSRKTDIEPSDIIQLSDDDEEEAEAQGPKEEEQDRLPTIKHDANGRESDELADDGFDEEEGSLKEGAPSEPRTGNGGTVEEGSAKVRADTVEDEDDDDVVIQEVVQLTPAPSPAPNRTGLKPSSARLSGPGAIPPGPLSMKQRYRASMENGGSGGGGGAGVPAAKQSFPAFIIARPKQHNSPPAAALTPATTPVSPPPTTSARQGSPAAAAHRCHFCPAAFPREELLRVHQKTHQTDAASPFRCRWCQKGFRYQQNYTLHVEKQTCRLLNGEGTTPAAGGGGVAKVVPMQRPVVANKRAW